MPASIISLVTVAVVVLLLGAVGLVGADSERKRRNKQHQTQTERSKVTAAVASWRAVVVHHRRPDIRTYNVGSLQQILKQEVPAQTLQGLESEDDAETKRRIARGFENAQQYLN